MNFYFCEHCGKRITDTDIDKGEARNKKLRGVYCASCAVGVMTMDSLQVIDEKNIAAYTRTVQDERSTESTEKVPSPEFSAHLKNKHVSGTPSQTPRLDTEHQSWLLPAAAIAAVLIVLGIFLALSSKDVPAKSVENKTAKLAIPQILQPPNTLSQEIPNPARAASKAVDIVEPKRIETDKSHETISTPLVTSAIDTSGPDVPTPAAARGIETANPEKDGPTVRRPAAVDHTSIENFIDRSLDPIRAQTYDRASEFVAQIDDTNAATAAAGALKYLKDVQSEFVQAAKDLAGRDVRLETRSGAVSGRVLQADNDCLKIERKFSIDGAEATASEQVKFDNLTIAGRESICKSRKPDTDAARLGTALKFIAESQWNEAASAAKALPEEPFGTLLVRRVETQKRADAEYKAKAAWLKFVQRTEKKLSSEQAKAWLADLQGYQKTYEDTEFVKDVERLEKQKALTESVELFALGLDSRLAGLFKGRILSYEPRTCEISVFYDFKDAAQLGDFVSVATASASLSSNVKVEAGKMKISVGNSWVELFGSDRYMSGQVRISMHYKVKDLMNNVFILFSGENSKGKAPQVQCGVAGHSDSNCRQGCRFEEIEPPGRTVKKVLGSTDAILPLEGQLEVGCKDREYFLKCDGKDVLKYSAPAANDHRGLRLAAGFDMYIEFQNMTITGRLDPSWLKSALSTDKR